MVAIDKVDWMKGFLMLNKRLNIYLICSLFIASIAMPVHAAYYTDVSVEYQNVDVDGTELNPLSARIKLGVPFSRELGVEASYAAAIRDDEVNGLKLESDEILGLYTRYNSPDAYGGMTVFLLAGYAWTTIKTTGAYAIPNQKFEGFSWGAGIEERSKGAKSLRYTFQYTRYYDNDGLSIDGYSLGLRYDF